MLFVVCVDGCVVVLYFGVMLFICLEWLLFTGSRLGLWAGFCCWFACVGGLFGVFGVCLVLGVCFWCVCVRVCLCLIPLVFVWGFD